LQARQVIAIPDEPPYIQIHRVALTEFWRPAAALVSSGIFLKF
jgi:hypothetical protein